MRVSVKYGVRDIIEGLRDGVLELNNGATAEDLLEKSAREAGIRLGDAEKNSVVFLVNGRPAGRDTVLSEGDSVRVLYKIIGG